MFFLQLLFCSFFNSNDKCLHYLHEEVMKKIEQNQNGRKSHILMLVYVNQLYKWLDKKPYILRQKSD